MGDPKKEPNWVPLVEELNTLSAYRWFVDKSHYNHPNTTRKMVEFQLTVGAQSGAYIGTALKTRDYNEVTRVLGYLIALAKMGVLS